MKLSLSTNWCNRRLTSGEEIADVALALGFDELELGFHTTAEQVVGFKRRLDRMPVGSIHAFCPVPLSAPQGYPELYSLVAPQEDARALARFHITKNIVFAAEMGADTVVLHAGRVPLDSFFRRSFDSGVLRAALQEAKGDLAAARYAKLLARAKKRRRARGLRLLPLFEKELAALVPTLEKHRVTLAFENLPYLEGFPDEVETASLLKRFSGAPIRAWFDTGHHRVRERHGWLPAENPLDPLAMLDGDAPFVGMHLNDVIDYHDDHLPPGEGKVDFAALAPLARSVRHIVFEPNGGVSEESLARGLAHIRTRWDHADSDMV